MAPSTCNQRRLGSRLHDNTQTALAIHLDHYGPLKTHMAQKVGLLNRRLRIQKRLVEPTIALEGVDREVAHTKRGEVLEEVRALAGSSYDVD